MSTPGSTSSASTRGVRVDVVSAYSPEHSAPAQNLWFFVYSIRITNEGVETVQLRNRHWIITDATGRVEEVDGPGVVGEQPRLEPGASFEYSSGCPLATPFGSMRGSYEMVNDAGGRFDVEIAEFRLWEPSAIH
jgi:ApaG protein